MPNAILLAQVNAFVSIGVGLLGVLVASPDGALYLLRRPGAAISYISRSLCNSIRRRSGVPSTSDLARGEDLPIDENADVFRTPSWPSAGSVEDHIGALH